MYAPSLEPDIIAMLVTAQAKGQLVLIYAQIKAPQPFLGTQPGCEAELSAHAQTKGVKR